MDLWKFSAQPSKRDSKLGADFFLKKLLKCIFGDPFWKRVKKTVRIRPESRGPQGALGGLIFKDVDFSLEIIVHNCNIFPILSPLCRGRRPVKMSLFLHKLKLDSDMKKINQDRSNCIVFCLFCSTLEASKRIFKTLRQLAIVKRLRKYYYISPFKKSIQT